MILPMPMHMVAFAVNLLNHTNVHVLCSSTAAKDSEIP